MACVRSRGDGEVHAPVTDFSPRNVNDCHRLKETHKLLTPKLVRWSQHSIPYPEESLAPVKFQALIFSAGTRDVPPNDPSSLDSRPIASTLFIASVKL